MTNQLQKIELENLERSESFQVNSLETANWAFKKLEALKAKETEINGVAEKELDRIKQWQSQELKSIESDKEYFEYLVTDYYKREKEKDDKFKLSTPYGKVTSHAGSKVLEMQGGVNEQDVIDQLEQKGLMDFVRITKNLNKDDIKKGFYVDDDGKLIDTNGEVLEGIKMVRKPTSYTVKVGE
ncbi:host-nuclease inhibitor Gam family protein [Staphylococcus pseudintermedius]|nr:host-nuclease inhibitor Gam family protein [Staphylococcus pseudintermedius]EJA1944822.1 host-nuclease inhibitor Gam family protein [Staphylococcus pseudintermedius]